MTEKEVKRGQPLTTASVASRPPTASPGGRKLSDWVAEFTGIRIVFQISSQSFVFTARIINQLDYTVYVAIRDGQITTSDSLS